jgi:hypothetical protein
MKTMPIPSIPGALAREDGSVKLPECTSIMPCGKERVHKTKWITGSRHKASKHARHEYLRLYYRGKCYKMHRLICEAFHGPAPVGKNVVLHLDENAFNNRPENLKWGTQKENLNMPKIVALFKERTGDNSSYRKGKLKKMNQSLERV